MNNTKMEEELKKPNPLIQEKHSLEPDMIFGWRPKQLEKKGPIPIFYLSPEEKSKPRERVIFHGDRPVDSFQLHKQFENESNYKFKFNDPMISAWNYLSKKNLQKYPDSREFIGMSRSTPANALHFSSSFESGNLDKVVMLSINSYDLYLRCDTNSLARQLWFYFSISNITFSRVVQLNIVNMLDTASIYDIGFRPVMFSLYNNKLNSNIGWEKICGNVKYTRSKLASNKSYFQLTIELDLTVHDTVFIAPSKPYTCSDLYSYLDTKSSTYLKINNPCESLGGIPLPVVTITDRSVPKDLKKYVIVTCRVHPVDVYSSHIAEGLIDFLLGPDGKQTRESLVFKIFPMGNPDGVVAGNTKTCLAGRDLNSCFGYPDQNIFPFAYYVKNLIKKLNRDRKLMVYFNVESNYKKKGSFMFGPYYPIHDRMYYMSRMIPKLFSDRTCMFRYFSCQFIPQNFASPHRTFEKEFGILGYSFQTSVFAYIDDNRETAEYTEDDLRRLGEYLAGASSGYMIILKENQDREKQRAKERIMKQRSAYMAKSLSDVSMMNIMEIIQKKEAENRAGESDIEKWTDEEDEIDEQPMLEIVNALKEFHHILEDQQEPPERKVEPSKKTIKIEQLQNRSLSVTFNVKSRLFDYIDKIDQNINKKILKKDSRNISYAAKLNKCSFGNERITHQTMPKLNPKLRRQNKYFSNGNKRKVISNTVIVSQNISHKNFPKPKAIFRSHLYYSRNHMPYPVQIKRYIPMPNNSMPPSLYS